MEQLIMKNPVNSLILGILVLAMVQAIYAQPRIAILNTEDDGDPPLKSTELNYITDKLREIAGNVLKDHYGIMTQESIVDKLGSKENAAKECRAASCLADLGRKLSASYITQARIGRFGDNYTFKVELYKSASGLQASPTITGNSKDIFGLLAVLDEKASGMFGNMLPNGAQSVAASSASVATNVSVEANKNVAQSTNKTPQIEGTVVPGKNLAEKLAWLDRRADSRNIYILEANADETIDPHNFEYKGGTGITIILKGDGINRTIRLAKNGNMFAVKPGVTFVLDNNITLKGHKGNNSLVFVGGGTLKMNAGSVITGNLRDVNGNNCGGGVYMNGGTFTMNGGTISGNTAKDGGGVCMNDGTFTMIGGTISGNIASSKGGGVYVNDRKPFNMQGGSIMGNIAGEYGGGVYFYHIPEFTKKGGIITGYNSDQSDGNAVKDNEGVIARRGHAIFIPHINSAYKGGRKETTAGLKNNLSCSYTTCSGDWD
ncbi:MAG: hypothetical protein LBH25_03245 [Fibromonadaceae bacterium]|jgi:hypothetical protein|nr:hypothetical protein [Fibromonadaceae bacterium]